MPHLVYGMAGSAGGLLSNVHDMLLYLKENALETNKAVRLSHQLTTDPAKPDGIGLCWEIKRQNGETMQLWHSGGMPGFSSFCVIDPKRNVAVVGLTNQSGLQQELGELMWNIILSIK